MAGGAAARAVLRAMLAGAFLLIAVAAARAQEAPPAPAAPAAARPEMQRLAPAVGEWSIELESRNAPDHPFTKLRTTSKIAAILDGVFLQEQFVLPTPGGRQVEMIGLWGYDRFRGRYRFAWLDDLFGLFDVMEGDWQEDRLVVDNTRSGTTMLVGDAVYHGRMIWGPFEAGGFAVESQVSSDGGATWWTQTRGRYTRPE